MDAAWDVHRAFQHLLSILRQLVDAGSTNWDNEPLFYRLWMPHEMYTGHSNTVYPYWGSWSIVEVQTETLYLCFMGFGCHIRCTQGIPTPSLHDKWDHVPTFYVHGTSQHLFFHIKAAGRFWKYKLRQRTTGTVLWAMDAVWDVYRAFQHLFLAEHTRLEMWVFMVKWQPSVTPRFFLTESDMGTDALPIVTDSGNKEERDLDFLPEDTIIAPVLLSLSLSLFTVNVLSRFWCHQYTSAWRGWDLGSDERLQFPGAESHQHMSGEGQRAF